MNPFLRRHRLASVIAVTLLVSAAAAVAMPAQAARLSDKAVSLMGHLCNRFCGCHHHHHGHEWCAGHEHFWCDGHQ